MARKEFSAKTKREAFQRADGRCEECGAKLFPGHYAYDHDLADGLGGKPTLANCRVLCDNCHALKTTKHDIPMMAKADRVFVKQAISKPSRNGFSTNRNGKWKKKMDGTVVRR